VSDDLLARLRNPAWMLIHPDYGQMMLDAGRTIADMKEAADLIEKIDDLKREIKLLRETIDGRVA
jgi:hypothetical protein